MNNYGVMVVMAGDERVIFFEEKPQWLEKNPRQYSEKIASEDLDIDKFMANMGFHQR